MKKIFKIIEVFKHPKYMLFYLDKYNFIRLPDKLFLNILYYKYFGKEICFNNPKTFNEKIQWLKLYDRKDIYTTMVDKNAVKKYVADIIGEQYIIPTIGVYEKFDDIDFDKLPNQFVMKCTHDSGGVAICEDKMKFDIKKAKKKICKSLKRNYYYEGREWPYKNVKPRIIIENYMRNEKCSELIDYKFFCFNGTPEFILTCSERFSSDNMCETFFDTNWNLMNIREGGHRIDEKIPKPKNLSLMLDYAKKLAADIPFVRIDFYEINNNVYFGEITFFPAGGYEKFEPEEWDYKFGELIDLSGVKKYEK